ncbi:MAG: hypothetical protein KKF30_09345 [Proteobacteria bacterium]|nr:hypothetical protein [Pseudomonadota bacterium]MBU4470578.1 hypothetical protein [Pseudomonadota bacterium]MCG2751413.1 hypothetical protein [Desulfobacteraceae bacterium]
MNNWPQASWTGVRDAVAWGDQSPQNPAMEPYDHGGMTVKNGLSNGWQ